MLPEKFEFQPPVGCLRQFAIGGRDVGLRQGRPVDRSYDVFFFGIRDKDALRLFELQLEFLEPLLEKGPCVGGCTVAALEIGLDVRVGDRVDDFLGHLGIGAFKADPDDGRFVHRLQ